MQLGFIGQVKKVRPAFDRELADLVWRQGSMCLWSLSLKRELIYSVLLSLYHCKQ